MSSTSESAFDWDPRKAQENARKHGVTFDEAQTVFLDDHAILIADPDHSDEEDRYVLLGVSSRLRLLVVCHCSRRAGSVIRLITARRADCTERREYERRTRR
jgi:uncharacterized DUF497 family protein